MRHSLFRAVRYAPGAALLLLALVAPNRAEAQATVHQVVIMVNLETGDLNFSTDPVVASPGDLIEFIAPQGAWRVVFNERTPFNAQTILNDQPQPRRVPVRGNADPGSYKYTAYVIIDGQEYSEDPEIVIRGGGGEGETPPEAEKR